MDFGLDKGICMLVKYESSPRTSNQFDRGTAGGETPWSPSHIPPPMNIVPPAPSSSSYSSEGQRMDTSRRHSVTHLLHVTCLTAVVAEEEAEEEEEEEEEAGKGGTEKRQGSWRVCVAVCLCVCVCV